MAHSLDENIFGLTFVLPSNPGAGNNLSVSLSATRRLLIHHVQFKLTTDANAGDRLAVVDGDAGIGLQESPAIVVQPASTVRTYMFSIGASDVDHGSINAKIYSSLAEQMYTDPTNLFAISIFNLKAGDTITEIVITAKQWAAIT